MGVGTPDTTAQVEDRIKADVQREAPDSNPYLKASWLRSLIAGIARRQFDFYQDLNRTENRLFPDTTDEAAALKWGNIYVGPPNSATPASGNVIATGTPGSSIGSGVVLSANGNAYVTTSGASISSNVINILSITRSGTTATVTTASEHNLASAIPVTIAGAVETEYNVIDAEITVTGLNTFTYQVTGSPASPATGTITASFVSASLPVISTDFGAVTNLELDAPLALQSPIAGVDDTMYVDFGAIGGGADEESVNDYVARYLDKIRNPVAHFSASEIIAVAKTVPGVTRVFVNEAGDEVGSMALSSLTQSGNVAKAVTATPHGFDDGQNVTITGANETDYNVTNARILVEDSLTFYYLVTGSPSSPATGTINASVSVPLGQVVTYFMRDNDPDPIPSASEVQAVEDAINAIRPANTSEANNIVSAPSAVVVDYVFTEINPATSTMRTAIENNIQQFHDEQTSVGMNVDEDAYRAAIKNTVDPDTGDTLISFALSSPVGDITINSGEIATKGSVTFP